MCRHLDYVATLTFKSIIMNFIDVNIFQRQDLLSRATLVLVWRLYSEAWVLILLLRSDNNISVLMLHQ